MKSVEEAKAARKKFEANVKKAAVAEGEKEKVEESIDDKMLKALTFDNGIMVSSLKELKEAAKDVARFLVDSNLESFSKS